MFLLDYPGHLCDRGAWWLRARGLRLPAHPRLARRCDLAGLVAVMMGLAGLVLATDWRLGALGLATAALGMLCASCLRAEDQGLSVTDEREPLLPPGPVDWDRELARLLADRLRDPANPR